MDLIRNPFYILGVTTRDNRRKIAEVAEEKILLGDSDQMNHARADITNPRKRLEAEMGWFPGVSPKNIDSIKQYLRPLHLLYEPSLYNKDLCGTILLKGSSEPIPSDLRKISSLALANILAEQLRLKHYSNIQDLCSAIIEIDKVFEEIVPQEILTLINEDRIVSGISPVENVSLIEEELGIKRNDIKSIISKQMDRLSEEEYIELINMIANIYWASGHIYNGVIIDDILDTYELKTKNILNNIEELIEAATMVVEDAFIDRYPGQFQDELNDLILLVRKWDRVANPLQLNAHVKGASHSDSEKVANIVRGLAIKLHNEHHLTDEAIELTSTLKDVFAELDQLKELFESDVETLEDIKSKQIEYEEQEQMILDKNKEDKSYRVTIDSESVFIPPYCTCCMAPTDSKEKITHTHSETQRHIGYKTTRKRSISMEFPICEECIEHKKALRNKKMLVILASLALSTGLMIVYSKNIANYDYAAGLYILSAAAIFFILGKIIKLPELSNQHSCREENTRIKIHQLTGNIVTYIFSNWRYASLFAEANKAKIVEEKGRNTVKDSSFFGSMAHPYLNMILPVAASLALAIFLSGTFTSPSSTQNAVSSSSSSKPSTTIKQPTQKSASQLKSELDVQKATIQQMESKLSSMEANLSYYRGLAERTNSNTYIDQYNSLLVEYNNYYAQYSNAIDQYNVKVGQYNNAIGK